MTAPPPDSEEPVQPPASHPEERYNRLLERATSVLTSVVASVLLVFVVLALAGVAVAALEPLVRAHDFTRAAIDGLDGAFLVIILLELVHTTLSRGPLARQLQEFLVIGITSGVRAGLEGVAQRGTEMRTLSTTLALDAVAVLVLVIAFCLVRQRVRAQQNP
jgi:phosphate starvation-inducible membrane PsiE